MPTERTTLFKFLLLALSLTLGACATTTEQPWERGRLARWDMQWQPDALEGAMADHVKFSKEGTSGQLGAAGGGCGCN